MICDCALPGHAAMHASNINDLVHRVRVGLCLVNGRLTASVRMLSVPQRRNKINEMRLKLAFHVHVHGRQIGECFPQ